MPDSPDAPSPPERLPDDVATRLGELTPEELRNTILHARELLPASDETESPIDPGPGEEILRVTEHEGYTEVVNRVGCDEGCSDCPHGPYLYHVTDEPRLEGTHHTHWSFLGRVENDDE